MYYKNMYFEQVGSGSATVIFLHGWLMDHKAFLNIAKDINGTCYLLDLPGFGKSKLSVPIGLTEYARLINDFIINQNILSPILVSHSFGGRVILL